MREQNELNEKLARWAGFTQANKVEGRSGFHHVGTVRVPDWKTPKGYTSHLQGNKGWLPDFCHDLNACFEWLVPKLDCYELATHHDHKRHCAVVFAKPTSSMIEATGDIAALALCRAIEKMIDGGGV